MEMLVYLTVWLFVRWVSGREDGIWPSSIITKEFGHFPYIRCQITNVMLVPEQERGVFYTKNKIELNMCQVTENIWHFGTNSNINASQCTDKFDVGHVILLFYIYGASNYFHLHWDTAIPLFKSLYYTSENHLNRKTAVLPSVESSRLQKINWQTDAFSEENRHKYWNEIIKSVTANNTYIPLDDNLLRSGRRICFSQLYFGAMRWEKSEKKIIQNFVKHVKNELGIHTNPLIVDRIGIISRKNRRRILNEKELVTAAKNLAATDLIHFEKLTYKQQIELMQNYTVVVGMNGAGLMNCVYLPPTSTCIQLVPYNAQGSLNFEEYGKFLQARGPYVEWHNTHVNMHVPNSSPHAADTTVHIAEFVEKVKEALSLARDARRQTGQIKADEFQKSLHDDL